MDRFVRCKPMDERGARRPRASRSAYHDAPYDREDVDADRHLWVDDLGAGRAPRGRVDPDQPKWSKPIMLTPTVMLRARAGTRAAYINLGGGLFLVGEIPEAATREEVGFLPKLASGILTKSIDAIATKIEEAKAKKVARATVQPVTPAKTAPVAPAVIAPQIGCSGRCTCRGGR